MVTAESGIQDLKQLHDQALAAAGQAREAVQNNTMMLEQKLSERTKLLSQLEQAKMQEQVSASLNQISELAAPRNTPSLDEVRDKIERRYANALGQADLANNSVEGRMLEVRRATVDMAGSARLEELRASLHPETQAVTGGTPASAIEGGSSNGAAATDADTADPPSASRTPTRPDPTPIDAPAGRRSGPGRVVDQAGGVQAGSRPDSPSNRSNGAASALTGTGGPKALPSPWKSGVNMPGSEIERGFDRGGVGRPVLAGGPGQVPAVHDVLPQDHGHRHVTRHGTGADEQRSFPAAVGDSRVKAFRRCSDLSAGVIHREVLGVLQRRLAVRVGESGGEGVQPADGVTAQGGHIPFGIGRRTGQLARLYRGDDAGQIVQNGLQKCFGVTWVHA